jgi:hypothetical protein
MPSLPDLAGVDLHQLRVMDDPELLAAVEEVLRRPELFAEIWAGDGGGQGGLVSQGHSVPALLDTDLAGA